ncbi:MAG: glutaredoxin family protein [Gammaproteobacteria bacterium]
MSHSLTLYYRTGCHLCEQMLAEIYALHGEELPIQLVDVDTDAALKARYGFKVPVLTGGEAILSVGKLDRARLEDYLSAR